MSGSAVAEPVAVAVVAAALVTLAVTGAALQAAGGARLAGGSVRDALWAPAREAARLLVAQPRAIPGQDRVLARIGVVTVPVAAVLAAAVIPVGGAVTADLAVGVVWFNAMEVLVWGGLWLAAWGSNSAYALVGGYRFVAQGLAYELPHMFALITAALAAGSLRVSEVAAAQSGLWFVVWLPVAFAVYLLSALAMAFWGPLGQPVDRSLGGGVAVELSSVDRLVFLAGRYLLLAAVAAMAVPLFLGGGSGPLLPDWLWQAVKTLAVLALLVWLRWRLPAVRMDRFMEVAWLVLIPAVLVQALVVAVVVLLAR